MVLARHQEHRLDLRVQAVIHAGHLELVIEIADRAQATYQHRGAILAGETDEQRAEADHVDYGAGSVRDRRALLAHQLHSLFQPE